MFIFSSIFLFKYIQNVITLFNFLEIEKVVIYLRNGLKGAHLPQGYLSHIKLLLKAKIFNS